jgi:hypothetical protein
MASTATRIYTVTIKHPGAEVRRLVRAYNQAQAIRHAAADTITASVATQDECVGLAAAGQIVEDAGDSPAHQDSEGQP